MADLGCADRPLIPSPFQQPLQIAAHDLLLIGGGKFGQFAEEIERFDWELEKLVKDLQGRGVVT